MKQTQKITFLFLVLFAYCSFPLSAQLKEKKQRIKSLVITETKYNSLISKEMTDSEVYYDSHGNVLEEIEYKQGKITKHFRYKYDDDGNKIYEEKVDPSGRVTEFSEYKIENGFRVEKKVYDSRRNLKSKKVYHYSMF